MKKLKFVWNMKTMKTFIAVLLSASVMSCHKQDDQVKGDLNNLPEKSAQVITSGNSFGLELFRKVIQDAENTKNTMVSPLSVALALSMATNGAVGETKTEMENTMKMHGLTPEQINKARKALVAALQSADPDVLLEIANAIYYRQGLKVKSDFVTLNKDYYNAQVQALNFASPDALGIINGWVASKTRNKIPTIIDQIDPDLVMVLLNAIYFNGIWKYKFGEKTTHNLPFTFGDGSQKEVAQMSQETSLEYTSNNLFSAIQLPYGKGDYRMTVILPQTNKSTGDVVAAMTDENWKNWMKSFVMTQNVVVTMPRFKFSWEMRLNEMLQAMGMIRAFDPGRADFSAIADVKPNNLFISFVIHKTYIDVNENGTEAAAVTGIGFSVTSAPSGKTYFSVDRPFLFAITEKTTGAILFIGEVRSPEYK